MGYNIKTEKLISFAKIGAQLKEIAAYYGCHHDTIHKHILKHTEYSNYSEMRSFYYEYSKSVVRTTIFDHAKKSPEMAKWLACNLMKDEFQMKPQPQKERPPAVRIIDSVEETNYSRIIDDTAKLFPAEKGGALIFDLQSLLPHQREFITSESNITVMVAGYGAGKTYAVIRNALLNVFKETNEKTGRSKGLIVYPTYAQARELFVEPFLALLEQLDLPYQEAKAQNLIYITHIGTIKIHTMQRAERIVGAEYTWAIVDEIDIEKFHIADMVHKKIVGRMRGKENAKISYVGTPEGYRFLYHLAVTLPNNDPEFKKIVKLIRAKSTDNPNLEKSYIDSMKNIYDPVMLDQYLNGEFVNLKGNQAVYQFNREIHVKAYAEKTLPKVLYVSMDFNLNPMSAEVWDVEMEITQEQEVIKKAKNIKEITLYNSNTENMCQTLKELFPDHGFIVFPDRSGASGSTTSNTTDIDIIKSYGMEVIYSVPIIPIRDSLIILNGAFSHNKIDIHPNSKELIADLEQVVTDNDGIIDKSNEKRTHWMDGLRYMVWMLTKTKKSRWG